MSPSVYEENEDYSEPKYWAPFILIDNDVTFEENEDTSGPRSYLTFIELEFGTDKENRFNV
jgi:hypothetical protein